MRLIDADELKTKAFGKRGGLIHTSDIDHAPTVDPVKHGRWEDCSNGWMCSLCKHDARKDYPYCPNCGARMDEEE